MFKIDIQESTNGRNCDINIRYFIELESEMSIPMNGMSKESLEKEISMTKKRLLELVVKEVVNERGELDVQM